MRDRSLRCRSSSPKTRRAECKTSGCIACSVMTRRRRACTGRNTNRAARTLRSGGGAFQSPSQSAPILRSPTLQPHRCRPSSTRSRSRVSYEDATCAWCAARRSISKYRQRPSSYSKDSSTTKTCAWKGRSAITRACTVSPTSIRPFTCSASPGGGSRSTRQPSSVSRRWKMRGWARRRNGSFCRCCRWSSRKSSITISPSKAAFTTSASCRCANRIQAKPRK